VGGSGPIRVLVVCATLKPGGAERHLVTVLPALDAERFEVAVCCIQERGDYFWELPADRVRATCLEAGRRRDAPRALGRLVAEMRRLRPHVVLTFPVNADVLGRVAATIARVPVVAGWKHSCGLTRNHLIDRWAERLLGPITDYCVGVSEAQLPFLVGAQGVARHKVRIVYNGVDLTRFPGAPRGPRDSALAAELGLEPDSPLVGLVARLRPEKDHETFFRAARAVGGRLPRARFLVVGDGEFRAEVRAAAERLGVTDRVVFTGQREDMARVLGLLDVSVLSSYNDCFPIAALESMAMGVPLVATAVGALPEIVEDGVTGHLVRPRDPALLAERIAGLLERPDEARAMGAAGRGRVEQRFTIERTIGGMEALFEEMVARAGSHPGGPLDGPE
jgi:glycosyltransferase involved in cell wall biosynthesis